MASMPQRLHHRQLEAFRAAVQLGSATAAADVLHISQPAVSRLIGDLEGAVGFALFERNRKGLQPTSDGLLLFEEIERSFRGLEQIASAVEAIRLRHTGRIRMAALPVYADGIIARLLGSFQRTFPGVFVELEALPKVGVVEGVAADYYDLGIATLPVEHPSIAVQAFAEGTAVCVAPAAHRFAQKAAIDLADLDGETFVAIAAGSPFRLAIQRNLEQRQIRPRTIAEVRTQRAICRMVAAGAGVSLVDSHLLSELEPDGIVGCPTRPQITWQIGMLTPSRRQPSHALQALMAHVQASAGDVSQA